MNENPKNDNELENLDEQIEKLNSELGETIDSATVIEENDRTVLLTETETIVIDKTPDVDIAPKNRPRKVYAGMWGTAEIATVSLALLAILTSILFFVFMVLPAKRELEANRAKRDQLEKELAAAKKKYGDITNTEEQVAKLTGSVNDFEIRLPGDAGQVGLYQRLNGLMAAYGLINTSGPDYEPLEIITAQDLTRNTDETGRGKFQSLFPGTYITTTVEGSYQNLRRFMREIETSDQFIMITAVELEPAENADKKKQNETAQQNQPPPTVSDVKIAPNFPGTSTVNPNAPPVTVETSGTKPPAQRGRTIGETVSLRIEMAAYFRRPDFVPLDAAKTEQPQ